MPRGTPTGTSLALAAALALSPAWAQKSAKGKAINPAELPAGEGLELVERLTSPAFGDLDVIRQRGFLRVLVEFSRSGFYLDKGRPRGLEYQLLQRLDEHPGPARDRHPLRVVFIPTSFERLIPDLLAGRGDVAAGLLTITEERQRLVDFSAPYLENVAQAVVSARGAPPVTSARDLSGRTVHVAASTSTVGYLRALSDELVGEGLPAIDVREVSETSAEDLLELAGSGDIDHTATDDYLATLWAQALPGLRLEEGVRFGHGGRLAWATRPHSPALLKALDRAAAGGTRQARADAAEWVRRYLRDPRRLRAARRPEYLEKAARYLPLVQQAAEKHGFDALFLLAVAFQESRFEAEARSHRGAIGFFQLLPSTAADVGYPDVHDPQANIAAGAAYLARLRRRYFDSDELSPETKLYFTLAAYNAGPGRVNGLRRKAARIGLDPNRWFGSVEMVALEEIGDETVRYVHNIRGYYITYRVATTLPRF